MNLSSDQSIRWIKKIHDRQNNLWFKIHTERVIGTILLTVGLAWGLTLTVLLFIA